MSFRAIGISDAALLGDGIHHVTDRYFRITRALSV